MSDTSLRIALTGGIASGKSTVADAFAALGVPVIDADVVARELVSPGTPALGDIVSAFGEDVLDEHGLLDRREMRTRVFGNATARETLDAILHPRIREAMRQRAMAATAPYLLLVIPLLVESGAYEWIDRVLVVDAPIEVQRNRLRARDGIDEALADAMLAAQASREQRLSIADDVIQNDGTIVDLRRTVADLNEIYLALARENRGR